MTPFCRPKVVSSPMERFRFNKGEYSSFIVFDVLKLAPTLSFIFCRESFFIMSFYLSCSLVYRKLCMESSLTRCTDFAMAMGAVGFPLPII